MKTLVEGNEYDVNVINFLYTMKTLYVNTP